MNDNVGSGRSGDDDGLTLMVITNLLIRENVYLLSFHEVTSPHILSIHIT